MTVTSNSLRSSTAVLFIVTSLLLAQFALAGVQINADENGVAIHGYDPVAYFTEGKPVAGDAGHSVSRNDTTYHFASAANKEKFEQAPEKYLPQYGGYCAFGTTMGKKFDVDPMAWTVVDDKLYLNLNPEVLKRWRGDIPGNIEKAEGQWPNIKDKAPAEIN